MKIAIFTDSFLPLMNGVATSICNQIKGLVKSGVEVIVFAPGPKNSREFYEGATIYRIKSRELSIYPGLRMAKPREVLRTIEVILELEEPDIYHFMTPLVIGWAGAWFASINKKTLISTYHTYHTDYLDYFGIKKVSRVLDSVAKKQAWRMIRTLYSGCSAIISPTEEMARILIKNNMKKVVVIPNSIDTRMLACKKKLDIRKLHRIPKSSKLLLFLGRIGFEKRIDILIDAMKKVDDNAYLLVVGKGPKLEHYKELISKNNIKNVKFIGYVNDRDVPCYYKACDAFVSASDSETHGITFIEAMFFGKPLIGSDCLGSKSMVVDGYNGLSFRAGNAVELAEKIDFLLKNPKKARMYGKNSKKMSRRFTIEAVNKQLIELYENNIEKKPERFFMRLMRMKDEFKLLSIYSQMLFFEKIID